MDNAIVPSDREGERLLEPSIFLSIDPGIHNCGFCVASERGDLIYTGVFGLIEPDSSAETFRKKARMRYLERLSQRITQFWELMDARFALPRRRAIILVVEENDNKHTCQMAPMLVGSFSQRYRDNAAGVFSVLPMVVAAWLYRRTGTGRVSENANKARRRKKQLAHQLIREVYPGLAGGDMADDEADAAMNLIYVLEQTPKQQKKRSDGADRLQQDAEEQQIDRAAGDDGVGPPALPGPK